MCPFSKEFSLLAKTFEYSDYLEDSDWKFQRYNLVNASCYSDLLEDTEWGTRSDDLTIALSIFYRADLYFLIRES